MRIVYHHRTRSTDAQRIHILEMANAFTELGHHVEIVSLVPTDTDQDNASRDAGDAIWQTVVRKIPFAYEIVQFAYNLIGTPLLAWKLMSQRTDFLYERYSLFNFTGVFTARLYGRPIALEVNSPFALEQQRDKQICAFALARWTERVICNLATKVIVVSTPLRDIMIQQGVRPDKLVVIPNGVRMEAFKTVVASPGLKTSLGVQGRTIIGFVGWFRQWHGLEMLVDAFRMANLAKRNVALLLIGDGPALPSLRQTVAGYGLTKEIVFTGPLPHAKVAEYLALVDIAVQPAANEYCCPMKIFEYMALGKAIVAPRQANILDILKETEGAFFAPGKGEELGRAMERLVADTNLRRKLGEASSGALKQRNYSWSANARKVIEILVPNLSNTDHGVKSGLAGKETATPTIRPPTNTQRQSRRA